MAKDPLGIQSFDEFLSELHDSTPLLAASAGTSDSRLATLDSMRAHLQRLYGGVEAVHSFSDADGNIFDCVPLERQPSTLRLSETPPKPPSLQSGETEGQDSLQGQFASEKLDRHGNLMRAPPGTIPMLRTTLQRLSEFGSLEDFLRGRKALPPLLSDPGADQKAPLLAERRLRLSVEPDGTAHSYSVAQQAGLSCIGCHSCMSVHRPAINRAIGQIFSLSQVWMAGGTGAALQTAEAGWQVYPGFYNHTHPALFVFFTPDGYATGHYNLTDVGFVQTSNTWALGGSLEPAGVVGGQQRILELSWYLSAGRWWLFLGGTSASNAVGYYPVSLYNGGALSTGASRVDMGGETTANPVNGLRTLPAMGSGQAAGSGWTQAAYHRDMRYFPSGGGSAYLNPSTVVDTAQNYTQQVSAYAGPWNRTFWYGGPGVAENV